MSYHTLQEKIKMWVEATVYAIIIMVSLFIITISTVNGDLWFLLLGVLMICATLYLSNKKGYL